jgi:aldehyde dehydrogenase (NAD+)
VPFAAIAAGDAYDVDLAVSAARNAVEHGAWGRLTATERGRLLSRLGGLVADHAEELAQIEARDTGKPMKQARADAVAVARYFEYYGGAADKIHGDTIPFLDGYLVATVYEPLGVTGHIIPWNYPGQMFGRTIAPALAMGNATVMKPAEEACLVPLRIAELAAEAGFPEGAINIVPGLGEEAGSALANHRGIDFISFTGSPEVGTLVQTAAARNHIGCTLELGGKSPQIVFADADLEAAVASVAMAIVQNAGQTCSAGSRVLVERKIWDRFLADMKARFEKIRAGTPEMDLDLGPVISAGQRQRILAMLERAEASGAKILAQGQIAPGVPDGGFYVTPTIYHDVDRGSEIAREEVFGPVLAAMPFDDEADAVRLANGTEYGLVAGV